MSKISRLSTMTNNTEGNEISWHNWNFQKENINKNKKIE